jgi:hypothetical protein
MTGPSLQVTCDGGYNTTHSTIKYDLDMGSVNSYLSQNDITDNCPVCNLHKLYADLRDELETLRREAQPAIDRAAELASIEYNLKHGIGPDVSNV